MSRPKINLAKDKKEWRERLIRKSPDLYGIAQIVAGRVALIPTRYPDNPPTARLVGGFVRDALLGLDSLDIDIEVYGTDPLELYAVLQDTFPGNVRLLGKSYEVLQILTHDKCKLEVNMPRTRWDEDRRSYFASDPLRTPEQAIRSKEFVCNSAQADPLTGEIFDLLDARKEFLANRLAVLDERNFYFNPLCAFRVLHFNTRFGLVPTPETISVIQDLVGQDRLREIHPRRIADELEKILFLGKPASSALKLMLHTGILKNLFPMVHDPLRPDASEIWSKLLKRIDRVQALLFTNDLMNDHYIANREMYCALLWDGFLSDYHAEAALNPAKAETTVRRKANQFMHSLQFEHPTLKKDFPKLISSLIYLDRLINPPDSPPTTLPATSTSLISRKERLKPRAKLTTTNATPRIDSRTIRSLAAAVRPFTVSTILDTYEAIQCGIPDIDKSIRLLKRQIR
jgi:tRNA nucleotidyltransferase/poly(A) polymerase